MFRYIKINKSKIDPVIVIGKWRHSLKDTGTGDVKRIDHNLLMAKLTLKLRKVITGVGEKWFDISKLKDPLIKREFGIALRNCFAILEDKTTAITINTLNQVISETRKAILVPRKKAEWISETIRLKDKKKITAQFREKDKKVKSSTRPLED